MTDRLCKGVGLFVAFLFLLAGCLGGGLLYKSSGMPSHMDMQRASQLTISYEASYGSWTSEERLIAEREVVALRTPKWALFNAGLSLCFLSLVGLLAIVRFRLWNVHNSTAATTPSTRWRFLALAAVAWLAFVFAWPMEIGRILQQDDLTPTSDAFAPAIISSLPILLLFLPFLLLIGRFVVLRNVALPASLWLWDASRQRRSLLWTIFYGLFAGLTLIGAVLSLIAAPWFFPSMALALYLLLSTRAALLNPLRPNNLIKSNILSH